MAQSPRSFLGVGWRFPVKPIAAGERVGMIDRAAYEDSVRQSIWIILGTAKGERVMRPDFGCGIYDLVFEINSPTTAARVSHAVREALLFFEPRIDVIDVEVRPDGDGTVMLISIDYEIRATDNVFNLVYPFYLERSSA
jgi:phage baseplate assembly protein W